MDLSAIANPYVGLITVGVGIAGATFATDIAGAEKRKDELIALHSKILESTLIDSYMDDKLITLIEKVERAPDALAAGQFLRSQRAVYKAEIAEHFNLPGLTSNFEQAIAKTDTVNLWVRLGEIVGALMIAAGFGLWFKDRNTAPPVG